MGIENVEVPKKIRLQMSWFSPRAPAIADAEYGETSPKPFCHRFSGQSEKNLRKNLWRHIIWQNHFPQC
jgi:hypothetical protein